MTYADNDGEMGSKTISPGGADMKEKYIYPEVSYDGKKRSTAKVWLRIPGNHKGKWYYGLSRDDDGRIVLSEIYSGGRFMVLKDAKKTRRVIKDLYQACQAWLKNDDAKNANKTVKGVKL
ncbi:hypothetical protein C4561_01420 [candidate division WWE3 bacterium]|uniref:Uncharacterized protein n=1 Tax=candidate division WWE3 bacterium TaxID=2053526 RepID=A0A3A4ZFB4_UNCKA|nr:MAG: hypothetical protein C4561_01420 [candidate division WWE3 bacterium]